MVNTFPWQDPVTNTVNLGFNALMRSKCQNYIKSDYTPTHTRSPRKIPVQREAASASKEVGMVA